MAANCRRKTISDAHSFARLRPATARGLLAAIGLLGIGAAALTSSPLKKGLVGDARKHGSDIALYRAEIERIRHGESYYQAAAAELTSRGYPTQSVFNWRTPLPIWPLGWLPEPSWGKVLVGATAGVAVLLTFAALAAEAGLAAAAVGGSMLFGGLMFTVLGESYVMPVLWAAALVALSLALYGLQRPFAGAIAGLAGLFCRELAGPYCALACWLAICERRWREVGLWAAGLASYAAFFGWHAANVAQWRLPSAEMHDGSWLQFGGAAFVISLAQVNGWLIGAPQAVAANYLLLALVGAANAASASQRRAAYTLCGYVVLFACVGYEFNQYWGVLLAAPLAWSAALAPCALAALARTAWRREPGSVSLAVLRG